MRADYAKRLPLDQVLLRLGYAPVKSVKGGRELWYASPFREETEPSMHISRVQHHRLGPIWVWKDFGDIGGNVIDFAIRYYNLASTDVSGALRKLDELGIGGSGIPLPPSVAEVAGHRDGASHPFTDVQIRPLTSSHLLDYVVRRGIDPALAQRYLCEIHYQFENRPFSALAFQNDLGGYEIRSTGRFKGTLPPKTITLLHPEKLAHRSAITVFEGFMDYLSALTYYGKDSADTAVLILNSVTTEQAAIQKLQSLDVLKLYLYLDRDDSGKQLTERFQQEFSHLNVIDHSHLYVGYNDFNDFLVAQRKAASKQLVR